MQTGQVTFSLFFFMIFVQVKKANSFRMLRDGLPKKAESRMTFINAAAHLQFVVDEPFSKPKARTTCLMGGGFAVSNPEDVLIDFARLNR